MVLGYYNSIKKIAFIAFLSAFGNFQSLSSQNNNQNSEFHEITLYVMPTLHPLDWSTPSSLYKTMKDCYLKTIGVPDNYLLGHMAVKIESPALEKPLLIAQTSGTVQEKTDLILKQKVGFAIMGTALTGRLETESELNHKLSVYAKRNKLTFIRYRINEEAMKRILSFIEKYKEKINSNNAACDFYGGAFWPRYKNEGASCTSFGIALLDVINLLPPDDYKWRLDLRIPQKLIGGSFNNGKKVKFSTIKKTDSWFKGDGELNKDYVKYSVYEPSIMFEWVHLKFNIDNDEYTQAVDSYEVQGLFTDKSTVPVNSNEPLFLTRSEPNLFIEHYFKKIGVADK